MPITVESEFLRIYNYYKDIRAGLLKGYILMQLSNMLLRINHNIHTREDSKRLYDRFRKRIETIRRNVKNLLTISPRDTWICDPVPGYSEFHSNTFATA